MRQTKPDVILLDLASDLDQACELIRLVSSLNLRAHVVGLHVRNDSDAILRCLRSGASEFLYAPFDIQTQNDAVARLHRLLQPGPAEQPNLERSSLSPAPSRARALPRWRLKPHSRCAAPPRSGSCSPTST